MQWDTHPMKYSYAIRFIDHPDQQGLAVYTIHRNGLPVNTIVMIADSMPLRVPLTFDDYDMANDFCRVMNIVL